MTTAQKREIPSRYRAEGRKVSILILYLLFLATGNSDYIYGIARVGMVRISAYIFQYLWLRFVDRPCI